MKLLRAHIAPSTRQTYLTGLTQFDTFCMQQGLPSLPAAATTVVNFLGHIHGKGRSFSTAKVYLSGIANNHRESQHADPTSSDMVAFA